MTGGLFIPRNAYCLVMDDIVEPTTVHAALSSVNETPPRGTCAGIQLERTQGVSA